MKIKNILFSLVVISGLWSTVAHAKISQPDYILYGTASWFGAPLPTESEISIRLDSQLVTVAKYSMGTNDTLNGLYALRIPMDSNDPREFGKARPGDPASVFINGSIVAEVLIGDYGIAERLDIDPINLAEDASVINITPASVTEIDSGQNMLNIEVTLSNSTNIDVSVDWENVDGTAIGSDICEFDVDYINSSGVAVIPAGSTTTQISVPVCGDTLIEQNETFEVVISNPQNGIIQVDRAEATILDNDGQPELRGYDAVVFEPDSGSLIQEFELKLSRAYEQEIRVDFLTVSGTASAGSDFVQNSGQIVFAPGVQSASILVEFLSDNNDEVIEVMTIQLSNPVNATLVSSALSAFILDKNKDEQTEAFNTVTNEDIPELLIPSDLEFSQDGKYLYVSSLHGDGAILKLNFNYGVLTFDYLIDSAVTGFESGLFGLIRDIQMTSDDRFLFAASSEDHSIMSFQRDLVTGQLSLMQTLENNAPSNLNINGVYALAISSDNNFLYSANASSDSITVFSINSVDGSLTFVESEIQGQDDATDEGAVVAFMDRPIDVTVSADGNQVFVAADFSSSLVVFDRNDTTGKLSYKETFKSGVSGVQNMGGASSVWSSNDNKHVYVSAQSDNSLVTFSNLNGELNFIRSNSQSSSDFIGLDGPNALVGNPQDDRIYALGFNDSTMVTFERNNQAQDVDFGQLIFADIEQDGVDDVDSLGGPVALRLDPDEDWVLVAAGLDNAIEVFKTPQNDLIFGSGFE